MCFCQRHGTFTKADICKERTVGMQYLFQVNIGPVQGFISSARRTRDLWFGSWLLSELSKAAANEIVYNRPGNSLIFPAPPKNQLYELLKEDSNLNVANKIVALINEAPANLGNKVYKAIEHRLNDIRDRAFNNIQAPFDRKNAEKQVDDLIEYFWVALPFENADYATVRRNLEALMVARKNTRDFKDISWGSGVPKSSIDGHLESVIPQDLYRKRGLSAEKQQENIKELYKIYSAGPAEQLSGVDLLKRRGNAGGKAHFPSTSHIATIPYLVRLAKHKNYEQAETLLDAYVAKIREIAEAKNLTMMIDEIPEQYASDWEHPILGKYDGSLLFEERLADIVTDPTGFEPAKEILRKFYALVEARPDSYYAILVADGDFMGAAIDAQTKHVSGPDSHSEISRVLAGFAEEARNIVKKHVGAPVYTGGDDVLAFMPLHTVLDCAKELTDEFRRQLSPFPYDKDKSPTLSVGIAIAHHLEALRDALNLARNAEKQAKAVDGKNALAIRVSKRSGEERAVVGHWDELDERIRKLMVLYQNGDIPEGMSYELRTQARRLAGSPNDEGLQQAKLAEAKRILQRKLSIRQKTRSQSSAEKTEDLVNNLLDMLGGSSQQGEPDLSLLRVEEFATELMVARTLADAVELTMP